MFDLLLTDRKKKKTCTQSTTNLKVFFRNVFCLWLLGCFSFTVLSYVSAVWHCKVVSTFICWGDSFSWAHLKAELKSCTYKHHNFDITTSLKAVVEYVWCRNVNPPVHIHCTNKLSYLTFQLGLGSLIPDQSWKMVHCWSFGLVRIHSVTCQHVSCRHCYDLTGGNLNYLVIDNK